MYGNTQFADVDSGPTLSEDQRRRLRTDLSSVAAETRELLPDEFAVGVELSQGTSGPQAAVAVRPPIGSVVSAGYTPDDDADLPISDAERTDLAQGLAASAVLQMKQAIGDDLSQTAQ